MSSDALKRDLLTTLVGQLLRVAIVTVNGAILARGLGVDARGTYALAIWFPWTFSVVVALGQLQINVTFAGLYREHRAQLFWQSVVIAGLLGGAGAVLYGLAFSFGTVSFGRFSELSPGQILLGAVLLPLLTLTYLMRELARGLQRIRPVVYVEIAAVLVQLTLTAILIWRLRKGAGAAIVAMIVFAVISLFGYVLLVWRRLDIWTFSWSGAFLGRCLKYGLVYLASSVSLVLNDTGVIVLLGILGAPTSDIGICAVACSLLVHVELVPQTVANVLLPHFSNDRENIAHRTPSIFRQSLICSALSIPALASIGLPILLVIFGRQYAMSVFLVVIALPGTIAAGAGRILEVHLNVLERPQYGLLAGCVRLGLLFSLAVVAYRTAGLPGIGLAVMLSRIAWLLVLVFFFLRMTHTKFQELIPRRSDLKSFFDSTAGFLLRFGACAIHNRAATRSWPGRGLNT